MIVVAPKLWAQTKIPIVTNARNLELHHHHQTWSNEAQGALAKVYKQIDTRPDQRAARLEYCNWMHLVMKF